MGRRAVFLDRDDTIARDVRYCRRPEDLEILPTVPEAIRHLNENGFAVVVVTNQSGITRGYFTEETLAQIHKKMKDELGNHGAWVDAIYYCPHHPDDRCECRKPKPGLLLQAATELGIDLHSSYMVGDAPMDVDAGKAAGCKTILVGTGSNGGNAAKATADYTADNLYTGVEWIVKNAKQGC